MLALLLAASLQAAATPSQTAAASSALGPDDVVARVSTTGMAVKLALPGYKLEDAVLAGLKRRLGDRAILQGRLLGDDVTKANVTAAYGEILASAQWRERLLSRQLVGAGQFDAGGHACTEHVRELQPPYADLGWHAFLTAADTAFDFSIFTLRNGDKAPFERADFERTVAGARFAVLRLGTWDALPAAVLDRMHSGLLRTDGAAWLAGQCATADDGWACALAAAEIGLRTNMDAAARLALNERALADLDKLESPAKPERLARLTALTGRAIALRDAGRFDEALADLVKARDAAEEHGPDAKVPIAYDTATVHAGRKDAPAAVAALREAIAGDVDRRRFAKSDRSFQPIADDKALLALLSGK